MTDNKHILLKWPVVLSGVVLVACGSLAQSTVKSNSPAKVEVRQEAGRWQLYVNHQPFFIKGGGGEGSLAKLKETGGNSIRTWGVAGLQSVLDEAQKQGLTVCVGIWLHHEHDTEGFDYSKPEMVKAQLEQVRQCVTRFKDHPAVLLWGIGNEMEGEAGDKVAIWNAVEAAAKLTKELDPNHPTMTVIAEIGGQKIPGIHQYCPDIDIIGINSYGGGPSVAERYAKLNGTKPYVITEFGPVGPWEIEKTSWGAAYEPTSTEKAASYRKTYEGSIANKPLCLGSYAFLWGQKQETTATWFGMFLKDGAKVSAVDTITELWTGKMPVKLCPVISPLKLADKREFAPGESFRADLEASSPDGQPVKVRWVVQPEQVNKLTAGAEENKLPELTAAILQSDDHHAEVRTPEQPGGYRLFAYVRNGAGAAVANVPFHVGTIKKFAAERKARLPFVIYAEQDGSNNHYVPTGWMGNSKAIKMDAGCRTGPHSGSTCLRIEYQATNEWGGVVWQDPPGDWGDKAGGWNLSGAKQLTFWARGENGGEEVGFKFGLLGSEKSHPDSDTGGLEKIKLTPEWKSYTVDLTGKDLGCIKTGFCWTLKGQDNPLTFYLDDIQFD